MTKSSLGGELFTKEDVEKYLREEVSMAGGAKKWLRKHKLGGQFDHILHMVEDGRAATLPAMQHVLKFKTVILYTPY